MGNVIFSCPICKADLQVDESQKGGLACCYQCDSTVMVPMTGVYEGLKLGNYIIDSLIGEGGMGQVWLANHCTTEQEVAIKVLSPALTTSADSVAKFMREIELSAKLNHPSLVTVMDAGAENGVYYYVTEYIDGENLKEKLEREGVVNEKEALQIAYHVADALKHAWNKSKIIHSDVGPSNIMLDDNGEIKILDLGIARTAEKDKTLTQTGMIVGSPHYMSPEQAMGDDKIDFRVDIYALGATLFHMVTGRVPFDGRNAISIISKHVNENLPSPQKINIRVTDECAKLIEIFMEKEKEERPDSWEEVLDLIDTTLAGKIPEIKKESKTDSRRFANTNFQKINLAELRNISLSAPKAEESLQKRPEKEKLKKSRKQKAKKINSSKRHVKGTQVSMGKSGRKSHRSDTRSSSARVRRAKKNDNTWLIVGVAGFLLVFGLFGVIMYNISKNREKSIEQHQEEVRRQRRIAAEKKAKEEKLKRYAQQASKVNKVKKSKPKSNGDDSKKIALWLSQNSRRVDTEKKIVSSELNKIKALIDKLLELDGEVLLCGSLGEENSVKPKDISYKFQKGTKLKFASGDYTYPFELNIQPDTIIEGAPDVQLSELSLIEGSGRTIVKNLNCKRLIIRGDCVFYNCKFETVQLDSGMAFFSKCLIGCLRPAEYDNKSFFMKCKFSTANRLSRGLIYCNGSTVIKIVDSALVPNGNTAIVVPDNFSGKLYMENCYIPSTSFGEIVDSRGKHKKQKRWKNLIKNSHIIINNCVEN